jgi:endonuclease YncB( thermonuclease family)
MLKSGALALAVLSVLGTGAAHAQAYYNPNNNTVFVPNPGYGTPSYGYGGQVNPGYVSQPNQQYYGQQPQFTVPGSATQVAPIGPSVNPTAQLGQQNTLQSPGNALGNQIRPPTLNNNGSSSSSSQRSVRGMVLEGTASVIDGDTFYVDQQIVLLYGADAPEIEQTCWANGSAYRCGVRAKEALARLIEGKFVSCIGQRQAGDAVAAVCTVPTGDVGDQMVASGNAVVPYELSKAYINSQEQAKNARRGVWAGPFEWPWDVRAKSPVVRLAR